MLNCLSMGSHWVLSAQEHTPLSEPVPERPFFLSLWVYLLSNITHNCNKNLQLEKKVKMGKLGL